MDSTRQSLLQAAREGENEAWNRLFCMYKPLIHWWIVSNKISEHDADELAQEVLVVVLRKLTDFEHSGNVGAFRRWLRVITTNQIRAMIRKRRKVTLVDNEVLSEQIVASDELAQLWDLQHDQFVIAGILDWLREIFDAKSIQIFEELVLKGGEPASVAQDFGVSVGSVYSIKSRILRKFRQIGSEFIDEKYFE